MGEWGPRRASRFRLERIGAALSRCQEQEANVGDRPEDTGLSLPYIAALEQLRGNFRRPCSPPKLPKMSLPMRCTPEERHRVYEMLKLRVVAHLDGTLEVNGALAENLGVSNLETTPWCH